MMKLWKIFISRLRNLLNLLQISINQWKTRSGHTTNKIQGDIHGIFQFMKYSFIRKQKIEFSCWKKEKNQSWYYIFSLNINISFALLSQIFWLSLLENVLGSKNSRSEHDWWSLYFIMDVQRNLIIRDLVWREGRGIQERNLQNTKQHYIYILIAL